MRFLRQSVLVPALLTAGMVLHVSMPGLGCKVAEASGGCPDAAEASAARCVPTAMMRKCCKSMERAAAATTCCKSLAVRPCGQQNPQPPSDEAPEAPCDDCTMGSCPVNRWVVLLEASQFDDLAAFRLGRVTLAVLVPVEFVPHNLPPPDPVGRSGRLAQQCVWLV